MYHRDKMKIEAIFLILEAICFFSITSGAWPGYLGCYQDQANRILDGKHVHNKDMTIEKCKDICGNAVYFGVEATEHCFCGNTLKTSVRKPEEECNMKCKGNKNQNCGGNWKINIYKDAYLGCYQDQANRILDGTYVHNKDMTIEKCKDICGNAVYFGVEATEHCFCGNTLKTSVRKPEGECNMKCKGNKNQNCGGYWKINIYETLHKAGYLGCYQDQANHILDGKRVQSKDMTVEKCKDICWNEYNQYYGVEAGEFCFCGDTLKTSVKKPGECNVRCKGDKYQNCGGYWRINIYKNSEVDLTICQ